MHDLAVEEIGSVSPQVKTWSYKNRSLQTDD
jgi:hypothetical protein